MTLTWNVGNPFISAFGNGRFVWRNSDFDRTTFVRRQLACRSECHMGFSATVSRLMIWAHSIELIIPNWLKETIHCDGRGGGQLQLTCRLLIAYQPILIAYKTINSTPSSNQSSFMSHFNFDENHLEENWKFFQFDFQLRYSIRMCEDFHRFGNGRCGSIHGNNFRERKIEEVEKTVEGKDENCRTDCDGKYENW